MSLGRARALAIVSALVVLAGILVIVAVVRDNQASRVYGAKSCPAGDIRITQFPLPDNAQIKLNIFNGNGRPGQAEQVAAAFTNRGFKVLHKADAPRIYDGIAKLSYGPKEVAAATVVRANFLLTIGPAVGYDPKRTDDVIDVTFGTKYQQLGTPTEVRQAIALLTQAGEPSPPPGTCAINGG
jgi:hypothetical protein